MFRNVTAEVFGAYFTMARDGLFYGENSAAMAAATSPFVSSDGARYFIDTDGMRATGIAGFVIRVDGELTNVFATVKGRGDDIMAAAIKAGADRLDCFDGYLPTFYARHGFVEVDRADNWTPGGPDVVYMRRAHRWTYDHRVSATLCLDCPTIDPADCDPAIVADFEGEPIRPSSDYCENPRVKGM